jgi:hypothetical protein
MSLKNKLANDGSPLTKFNGLLLLQCLELVINLNYTMSILLMVNPNMFGTVKTFSIYIRFKRNTPPKYSDNLPG